MRHAALFFLSICLSQPACPGARADTPEAGVSSLVQQARANNLARDPYWLTLLHYRTKAWRFAGDPVSEITSADFFLSPQGSTDPDAELAATLTGLFKPAGQDPDAHAQCRFVARHQWLRKALDWGSLRPPPVSCPAYLAYTNNHRIESLSLVFATGYLSNPASFFGHILLKFNTQRSAVSSALLDRSVNFGADVPAHENGFKYVFNGLFGGYRASFSHHQFYTFNHAYAENELRDLWEYVLDLKDDEVDQLLAHSWELLGRKYVYYFLNENCAYHMAGLLNLVIEQPLLPALPWSLPSALFEKIAAVQRNGVPLVKQVRRIPSRQSRFHDGFLALDAQAQAVAGKLVDNEVNLADADYAMLPEPRKIAVTDTLLDYYEYRIVTDRQSVALQSAKQEVLIERAGLRAVDLSAGGNAETPSQPAAPHEGTLPFLFRAGPVHNSQFGSGMELQLRPGDHDRLALDVARVPGSHLTILDLRMTYRDDTLTLRSLDLLAIENPNLPATRLPGDAGWAWKFRTALEDHDLACSQCKVWKLEGGLGKALPMSSHGVALGMLDLAVQQRYQDGGSVAFTPQLGFIFTPSPYWKSRGTIGVQSDLNGARGSDRIVRWENRFGSSRHWDLRLSYEERRAREVLAAISIYL